MHSLDWGIDIRKKMTDSTLKIPKPLSKMLYILN